MPAGDDGALARAREFERGSVALVADVVTPIPEGWLARTPSLPLVSSLNLVTVTRPIALARALELTEEHLGGLQHRQLVLEDQPSGQRLAGELRSRGWKVECNLTLTLRREADHWRPTDMVIEPSEEEVLELMRRWTGEDEALRRAREAHRQVVEASRLTWLARSARRLGVRDDSGALAAMAFVFSDGEQAQVEDVYAVAEARGRGFGRAVLTRAVELVRERGYGFTFIVADDNDWPKLLYAKLGFDAVGRTWIFHR